MQRGKNPSGIGFGECAPLFPWLSHRSHPLYLVRPNAQHLIGLSVSDITLIEGAKIQDLENDGPMWT